MPDETSTPPADIQAPPPQSGDTATGQASEPEQFSSENLTDKPVSAPVIEPPKSEDTSGQATPPSDLPTDLPVRGTQAGAAPARVQRAGGSAQAGAAASAPEPESLSQGETETGKPNTPATPSVGTDTPPQPLPLEDSVLPLRKGAEGGEETPAPEQVSENLTGKPESLSKSETETGKQADVSESVPEPEPLSQSETGTGEPVQANPPAPQTEPPPFAKEELTNTGIIAELLTKARAKIQERRRKKLEKIMTKVTETGKISNDDVQKLLRVSDATATRYLDLLEKEGLLRQEGKTGKYVVYVRA